MLFPNGSLCAHTIAQGGTSRARGGRAFFEDACALRIMTLISGVIFAMAIFAFTSSACARRAPPPPPSLPRSAWHRAPPHGRPHPHRVREVGRATEVCPRWRFPLARPRDLRSGVGGVCGHRNCTVRARRRQCVPC